MTGFMDEAAASVPSNVLVTGGAGYVGCVLVPRLLARGHTVTVLDLMLFGSGGLERQPGLRLIQGDIRDRAEVNRAMRGQQAVIHLAGMANDACFDLAPQLSQSINHDAFKGLVLAARHAGVQRFVFASAASVYGISGETEATEEHRLVPLSDYNRCKGLCECLLLEQATPEFTTAIVRAATCGGPSPRMRFDLLVNALVNQAVQRRKMTLQGGSQFRPFLHVEDLADLYVLLLEAEAAALAGETFNAVAANYTIVDLARRVRSVVEAEFPEKKPIEVTALPGADSRSYSVSGRKLAERLGFVPLRSLDQAISELCAGFKADAFPDSLNSDRYYNAASLRAKRAA